jgi:hypothetical protein
VRLLLKDQLTLLAMYQLSSMNGIGFYLSATREFAE